MKNAQRIFLFSLTLMASSQLALADESQLTKTQLVGFQPSLTLRATKKGYCWTESLKTSRPDTWRCMIGNEIQDPCFGTSRNNMVVCGVNPATSDLGFGLSLTKPLPKLAKSMTQADIVDKVWLFKLTDGTVCTPFTGTLAEINGQTITYSCHDASVCGSKKDCDQYAGVLSINSHTQPWTAIKVIYAPNQDPSTNSKQAVVVKKLVTIPIATAWQ